MELIAVETEYLTTGAATRTNLVSVDTVLLAGDLLYGTSELAPVLEEKINRRTIRRNILPSISLSAHFSASVLSSSLLPTVNKGSKKSVFVLCCKKNGALIYDKDSICMPWHYLNRLRFA